MTVGTTFLVIKLSLLGTALVKPNCVSEGFFPKSTITTKKVSKHEAT